MEYAPHKKTILIVDDEPKILEIVSALLGDSQYNIITATSGSMGLQLARTYEGEIGLLLSDFQMPGMSGVDLAIAMTLDRPQLKVLLMSGLPKAMPVLNQGWHFLPKPFIASQLRALVTGLVFPDKESEFLN